MNTKTNLRLIEGGMKSRLKCTKEFVEAYVTDTRLMGAMGMCIRWKLQDCLDAEDLVQFFLLDPEELGLESYTGMWEYNPDAIHKFEQTSIGCLGGKKIGLTEKEACYLVSSYYNMSVERNKKKPQPVKDYQFILDRKVTLDDEEKKQLLDKVCTKIFSDYQTVNYFLMRLFGNDPKGALYLANPLLDSSDFSEIDFSETSYFCKNTITTKEDCYISESLVNVHDEYFIFVSKIQVYNLKVSTFSVINKMHITPREAAMILNRREYISVYEMTDIKNQLNSPQGVQNGVISFELPYASNCSMHTNGQMIMAFKPNNHHVAKEVYRLNDDIVGSVFITTTGQLVITSYTLNSINLLETYIVESCDPPVSLVEKFTFREALMQDFVDSSFDDFMDFIDFFDLD